MLSKPIEDLIAQLSRLPGLGPRSARRAALYMLQRRADILAPLARTLDDLAEDVSSCVTCGNITTEKQCPICSDQKRARDIICVVEQVGDLWAIERGRFFKGQYHVLGGTLSAFDGVGPDDLRIPYLVERIEDEGITEVILALGATLDGQTTAHVIADMLKASNVSISGLAQGMPVGGELDYLDEGTIETAFRGRNRYVE